MKKKYSALPELLLRSIFYTLINYVLLSMVLSFRLHWSSILFSAAMLWFALDYSKTIPAVDRQTASRRPFVAWLHSHQHIYCILCRVHSRLVRIILTKKTGAVGRTYSSGLSFYVTKR